MADPWLRIIKTPNNAKTTITGNNQYFFLSLIKLKNNINYVKGANVAGFIKVADAMIDQGVV